MIDIQDVRKELQAIIDAIDNGANYGNGKRFRVPHFRGPRRSHLVLDKITKRPINVCDLIRKTGFKRSQIFSTLHYLKSMGLVDTCKIKKDVVCRKV